MPRRSQTFAGRLGSALRPHPARGGTSAGPLADLVIISGFSGAGKSLAMNVFEDAGYFCVDNLPARMIRSLSELFTHEGSKVERAAVVCDLRGGDFFDGLVEMLDELDEAGVAHRLLFLQADEQTLLSRYKETRRRHPLAPTGNVADGIAAERVLLAPLVQHAEVVVDTTGLTANMLRRKIASEMLDGGPPGRLALTFTSFGHKHGPVRDADLAFDVRFLSNPHWEPHLRQLTGFDPRVVEHIARDGRLTEFYDRLFPLIDYVLPQYVSEGKSHLVVAVGCTGGRHRSVAIAERLAARYRERDDLMVEVSHRDVDRAPRGP